MNNENNRPGMDRDNNQWNKEQDNAGSRVDNNTDKDTLENRGPNKDQNFNALNPDGSLPDMPEENAPGKGALDGTVGLGT